MVGSLHHVCDGAEGVAVDLKEQATALKAGVDDEAGELEHHVLRVASRVWAELVLEAVDQLAAVVDGQRFLVALLRPHEDVRSAIEIWVTMRVDVVHTHDRT